MDRIITGEDVKRWRELNRYKQEVLAAELGVKRQTVGNWERNNSPIPRHLEIALLALAKFPGEFRRYDGKRVSGSTL